MIRAIRKALGLEAESCMGAQHPSVRTAHASIEQLITFLAASARRVRPTPVEPVKESLRTRGSASMAPITGLGRRVVSTLMTPGGTPASSHNAAIA